MPTGTRRAGDARASLIDRVRERAAQATHGERYRERDEIARAAASEHGVRADVLRREIERHLDLTATPRVFMPRRHGQTYVNGLIRGMRRGREEVPTDPPPPGLLGITRTTVPRYPWQTPPGYQGRPIRDEELPRLADNIRYISAEFAPGSKQALTDPNVANRIHRWLETNWPEVITVPGLWFTGSSVWSHLYGRNPHPTSDLDVIAETLHAREQLKQRMDLLLRPAKEGEKTTTSLGGERLYIRDRSSIDLWVASNPFQAIKAYASSHAHARAAYSTTLRALFVLPNEAAW